MSNQVNAELQTKTQQLLDGPLKHVRAAALAAALLPLASIAATPASAQTPVSPCVGFSGGLGTCGILFTDTNGNGTYDVGVDTPISGYTVTACADVCTVDSPTTLTNLDGSFSFDSGTLFSSSLTQFVVLIPTGTQPSPKGVDNIGTSNGSPFSSGTFTLNSASNNFGFVPVARPGTGTPGYWKNHPDAWPVPSIQVGTLNYPETQAITYLSSTGKDKSITMFQSYAAAYLSIANGSDGSCVAQAMIDAANWLMAHQVGTGVAGGTAAWAVGQPIQSTLDAYDNGLLCAPHRK